MEYEGAMFVNYSPLKLSITKVALSAYLIYFFMGLFNEGYHIFSFNGFFANNYSIFNSINPLQLVINDFSFKILILSLSLISLSILFSRHILIKILILWFFWISFNSRIPFYIPPPSIGYLGFFLLFLTQIKITEKTVLSTHLIKEGLWFVVALSYFISGVGKVLSPTWSDGLTLVTILNSPLGQENFITSLLLNSPIWLQKAFSFGALFSELLFLPLALFKKTRPIALLMMTLTHLGIISLLNIQDIPLAILIIHLFLIDEGWFKPAKSLEIWYNPNNIKDLKFKTLLDQENFYNCLKFNLTTDNFMVKYNGQEIKGFKAKCLALSHCNGFWAGLRLFIR